MKSAREHDAGRANGLAAELERLRAQAAEQTTARGKLEGELARLKGEREEQAKPDHAQGGRLAEQVVGGGVVVDVTTPGARAAVVRRLYRHAHA